ncbi:MAG TPA: glucosaminidase domain-containing protein [Chitinophagaceae bacterium]|nr:glucosaminidase domain-containing protein [Chitinophagaceae bacterium]
MAFFLLASISLSAQQSELVKTYISQYKDLAIAEMIRTGVPASIKLAQGINETMAGTSNLVISSNNHFGIKCKSTWTGETIKHDDDLRGECFRKYPSPQDSYRDHSDFLKGNQRYAFLFNLDPTDYSGWAWGLKKAGYATNPRYAAALIKTIEDYGLQDYCLIALGKMPGQKNGLPSLDAKGNEIITGSLIPVNEALTTVAVVAEAPEPPAKKNNYPKGEFRINETKVVYVPKGTPYLAIANEYEVDLSKLFEFNELPRAEEVDKDRLVFLQRKRKTGNSEFHTVQAGETLHDIAQQQAIRLESLQELNWLKDGDIPAIGEQLNLQKRSNTMPKLAVKDNYSLMPGTVLKASN